MKELTKLVKAIQSEAEGGKEFFDILDDELGSMYWCSKLYNMIKNPFRYTFITSGTFGRMFVDFLKASENREWAGYILFPGGMREGMVKAMIDYDIPGDHWINHAIYIDDSYYSGTTRLTALHTLYVPKTIDTYVIYDGSPGQKHRWLHSLYRYHPEEGM